MIEPWIHCVWLHVSGVNNSTLEHDQWSWLTFFCICLYVSLLIFFCVIIIIIMKPPWRQISSSLGSVSCPGVNYTTVTRLACYCIIHRQKGLVVFQITKHILSLHMIPQALCVNQDKKSFSLPIHSSTGLLGRERKERERVSINHTTPGDIYAHSNAFNKESSPWSNILSGTSSLSPSFTLPPLTSHPHPHPPTPSPLHIPQRPLIVKWQKMLQQCTDRHR